MKAKVFRACRPESAGGVATTLASFDGSSGAFPSAGSLSLDADGNLYGTTSGGGTAGDGTVFELVQGSNAVSTVASFDAAAGASPQSGLVRDAAGDLYGAASSGGVGGGGTVFRLAPAVVVAPPAVVSVTPEDAAGDGAAAGSLAKGQRSMVTQLAVVFSEPVGLFDGAFSLGLVNNFGSGTNDATGNTPDTDISYVLGTPVNPSGDGITWVIPIVQNGADTTFSYALKGTNGGPGGASLNDGVYQVGVQASDLAALDGQPLAADFISPTFHRLFGDIDGNGTVNTGDYIKLKRAFGISSGAAAYNADFDSDGNGAVNTADYVQFKKRFGTAFTY